MYVLWNAFPEFKDPRDAVRAPAVIQDLVRDFSDWRNVQNDLPARGNPQLQSIAKMYISSAALWAKFFLEEKV